MIYLTLLVSVLNFVLAGISLYANNFFANQRERRKETRSKLDEIIKQLEALQASALVFHTNEAYDEGEGESLVRALTRMQNSVGRVVFFRDDVNLVRKVVAFRQAISARNFEEAEFSQQRSKSDLLLGIVNAKEELHSVLEQAYEQVFPVQVKSWLAKYLGR